MIAITAILVVSATIQGICDVLATSGVGQRGVVYMWAVDAAIALVGIGALARGVDRVDRRRLGVALLWVFAGCYGLVSWLTRNSEQAAFWWGSLGVIDTLQSNLVVLLAWAIARDLFTEGEAVRLFGLLGGLAYIGTLGGTGLAALVAGHASNAWLLPICALLAMAASACVGWLVPPHVQMKRPEAIDTEAPSLAALFDTATLRYLWRHPTLRWLSAIEIGNALCWTMMSLAVLLALQNRDASTAGLQRTYAELRFVGPLAHALMQAAFSGWLLRKLGYGRLFLATPLVLLGNLIGLGLAPGLAMAWAASLLIQLVFGAEGAAAHALLVRVPAHRRGRVGTFVMGTLPQVGYLLGCALLLASQWLADLAHLGPSGARQACVGVAALAAGLNVHAGVRLRRAFAGNDDAA